MNSRRCFRLQGKTIFYIYIYIYVEEAKPNCCITEEAHELKEEDENLREKDWDDITETEYVDIIATSS